MGTGCDSDEGCRAGGDGAARAAAIDLPNSRSLSGGGAAGQNLVAIVRKHCRIRRLTGRRGGANPISMPAYTNARVGDYPGFLSVFVYFVSACPGNTSYRVLIKPVPGWFPDLRQGFTAISSVGIWLFDFTVLRWAQQPVTINKIVADALGLKQLRVEETGGNACIGSPAQWAPISSVSRRASCCDRNVTPIRCRAPNASCSPRTSTSSLAHEAPTTH